jgi:hypothetical protein
MQVNRNRPSIDVNLVAATLNFVAMKGTMVRCMRLRRKLFQVAFLAAALLFAYHLRDFFRAARDSVGCYVYLFTKGNTLQSWSLLPNCDSLLSCASRVWHAGRCLEWNVEYHGEFRKVGVCEACFERMRLLMDDYAFVL